MITWMLIPPSGLVAISRQALPNVPEGCRLASETELLAANRGAPFPWGRLAAPQPGNQLWDKHRVGVGGLYHEQWFVTASGRRYGGAANVPTTLPGSLRSCLYLDGGAGDGLAENEGYAVVSESSPEDRELYRRVQLHAAEHVNADDGAIIVSPIGEDRVVHVGFVGRCGTCPNVELISFRQLRAAVPGYSFRLWPEWEGWKVE